MQNILFLLREQSSIFSIISCADEILNQSTSKPRRYPRVQRQAQRSNSPRFRGNSSEASRGRHQRRLPFEWPGKCKDHSMRRLSTRRRHGCVGHFRPRRDIIIAARTREQGREAFDFAEGFARPLPQEDQVRFKFRYSPRLEIEFDGYLLIHVTAADGKSALGSSPTLDLMDERGHWATDQDDALEHALLSGIGKRNCRALNIWTSARTTHIRFRSGWIWSRKVSTVRSIARRRDCPPMIWGASKRQNPRAAYGIGQSLDWLQAQARRAITRGGSNLTSFRLYNRNEHVSAVH